MTLEDIKKQVAHLPHVKKVWVKGNDVYIQPVKGATEHDLTQEEKPVKTSKKLKDGSE